MAKWINNWHVDWMKLAPGVTGPGVEWPSGEGGPLIAWLQEVRRQGLVARWPAGVVVSWNQEVKCQGAQDQVVRWQEVEVLPG